MSQWNLIIEKDSSIYVGKGCFIGTCFLFFFSKINKTTRNGNQVLPGWNCALGAQMAADKEEISPVVSISDFRCLGAHTGLGSVQIIEWVAVMLSELYHCDGHFV